MDIVPIIALPAISNILNSWLKNFAFRFELNIWWYVISLFTVLALSVLSTAFQTINASLANPVDSIRNERLDGTGGMPFFQEEKHKFDQEFTLDRLITLRQY